MLIIPFTFLANVAENGSDNSTVIMGVDIV